MNQPLDEKRPDQKIRDWALFMRLWPYVAPLKKRLIFCAVLTLILAGLDLVQPLLVRRAIDRHLTPNVLLLDGEAWQNLPENIKPLCAVWQDSILVDRSDLGKTVLRDMEAHHWVLPEKYLEIPSHKSPPGVVIVGERHFLSQPDLARLPADQIRALRADDFSAVTLIAQLWLLLLVINFFGSYLVTIGLARIGHRATGEMRQDLYRTMLRFPIRFFQKEPLGRLVTRVANDINSITEFFTGVLVFAIKDVVLFFGVLAVMFAFNARMTLVILALAPPLTIAVFFLRSRMREAFRRVRALLAKINGFLQESVSGMEVVNAFVQEKRMAKKLADLNQTYYRANLNLIKWNALFRPLVDLASNVALGLLLWYGGLRALDGSITLGEVVASVAYLEMLFLPIKDLSEKYAILQGAMTGTERVTALLDLDLEPSGEIDHRPDGPMAIHFDQVDFHYQREESVLRGLELLVPAGESHALVGPTGGGKSTTFALLQALEFPVAGQVTVDGIKTSQWRSTALRKQMAVVLQDVILFAGTLRENITLGRDISEQQLQRAMATSRINDIMDRFPDGLKTHLIEGGKGLSAGERQLISFARALVHEPTMILMDEATAHIDSQTEKLVQEGLSNLLKNRTSLIIAHRLSTIQHADCIHFLTDGHIIESGSHQALLEADGAYANLVRLQRMQETA